MRKLRLAVLVSGGGTNLQALIDRSCSGALAAEIVVVASDREDAYGLLRARNAGIPAHFIDYRAAGQIGVDAVPVDLRVLDREQRIIKEPDTEKRLQRLRKLVLAEQRMLSVLEGYKPNYVCLAGFMRLVSPFFLKRFNQDQARRVLNIHPALLPSFPGQHGYEDTFEYGCKWGGVTVHFVDEGEDTGPIIAQAAYPIWPHDDVECVRKRGLELEYEIYAQAINWLAQGYVNVHSEAGKRVKVVVSDPSYKDIMSGWIQRAFS